MVARGFEADQRAKILGSAFFLPFFEICRSTGMRSLIWLVRAAELDMSTPS